MKIWIERDKRYPDSFYLHFTEPQNVNREGLWADRRGQTYDNRLYLSPEQRRRLSFIQPGQLSEFELREIWAPEV